MLVYLLVVFLIGLPLLWGELAAGQRGQGSSVRAWASAAGPRWRFVGWVFLAVSFVFLGQYMVIAGLALRYAISSFTPAIEDNPSTFLAQAQVGSDAAIFALLFALVTLVIVAQGLRTGLERANLVMMPALFALIAGLALYAVTRPGAGPGIEFYMSLDRASWDPAVLQAAVAQAFFSIGIGFGIMLTFASYTEGGRSMLGTSATIAGADLAVALTAGFMIFPLAFAEGLQADVVNPDTATTTALFLTIPTAFASLGGVTGKILLIGFFSMLSFAALSSTIAVLEVLTSHLSESYNWTRSRAATIATTYAVVPGLIGAMLTPALDWLDALLTVLLLLSGLALCLPFSLAIRNRAAFLSDDAPTNSRVTKRLTSLAGFLLAYIAPLAIAVILLLNLPNTAEALFGLSLDWPW